MNISSPRLAGIISGIFAVRAFDVSMSVITQLALSSSELIGRLVIAAPSILGAIGSGVICCFYLRERQARWQHIVTVILLCLGILSGGFMIATPLIVKLPAAGFSGSMITRGVVQVIFSAIAIGMVAVLLKRSTIAEPGQTNHASKVVDQNPDQKAS